ncbi:hypothetical protein HYH03_003672 [Edaphochlamys debaryana]|uniref:Eukaryotic translation initiation factor 3 subunit A n=1 Tax=Edaphochlamys debaryana TaxID=47281 RepID=A0A836C461_9CHLO|nr:hypothetical protein HYH03_003672 [Edaphochlamys debaryana]|eukprot:KAG2498414.1 hypothetical protein HYH03_003672 [Edaphochlamys debaryana]
MARVFRGGGAFARPENALKRADELEAIGQKSAALQTLHDVVCSKRHRTWSKTFEAIMMRHVELCVDMQKRTHAKEALLQYRNMCHQVNINSLEEVIKHFLKRAADKAEEAQAKAAAATLDVEDLEEDASPEELMLSYVSGEKNKDRTDRELVTPWFRFLWESYRSVLEILRTNPKLEPLYAMTATKAFHFCLQYKRTTEFKRLCDILRQHLTNLVNKFRDQRDAGPESMTMHLESRFEQLRVACELELWGEAFRSVEDIQQLIALTKKTPKQPQLASYYTRLTQIFAVSDSPLYHAFAWLKLFSFARQHARGMSQADYSQMATAVLLAVLAILPYERGTSAGGRNATDAVAAEQEKERANRMAIILGYAVDAKKDARSLLTRQALLATITSSNLLSLVPPEARAIYDLLSQDFNPLELCQRLSPLLDKLPELAAHPLSSAAPVRQVALDKYTSTLKQTAVLRLLKQLSEVYSVMRIDELGALVPFYSFAEVEAVVVDAVKYEYLQMRVDHRNGTLHFGAQHVESDKIRGHLAAVAKRLAKAVTMMSPLPQPLPATEAARRQSLIKAAKETLEGEHIKAVARKMAIEKKKEETERAQYEAEQAEKQRLAAAQRLQEQADEKRRKEEAARREADRLQREMEEREQEELRAHLGARNIKVKEGEKLEKTAVIKDIMSERIKEQQEMERRLARQAKNLDHLERARREEEAPFLETAWKDRQEEERAWWEQAQKEAARLHREAWEVDIEEKKRLAHMVGDKEVFKGLIMQRREAEFQALRRERERRMAEMRAQRKYDREVARRKAYVTRCRQQVEDRIAELHEQRRREEIERKKAEEAERQRKLDEALAKQRAREEEIERRKAEERAALGVAAPPAAAAAAPAAAAAASGAGGPAKFVPRHLRGQAEGAGSGGGAAPPAAAAAAPPARDGDDDGWRRRGPEAPPPARDFGGAPRETWRDREAPPRDREVPPRDMPPRDAAPPASGSSGGGKFVPPALRGAAPAAGAAPPPAPSGAGGAYRPPNRR